jgi:DNA-binding FadR family transcriptional regulator
LVSVLHGGGTHVLDYRDHAGLDLLAHLAQHTGSTPEAATFWLAVLEMRANIAADLVRLCALRGSKKVKAELVAIADRMRKAETDQDLFALEVRFWHCVHDGADNIAYRLAFNSMLAGVNTLGDFARTQSVLEVKHQGYRVELAKLIAAGDADEAEATTRATMRAGVEAVRKLLRKTASPSATPAPKRKAGRRSR